MCVYGRLQILYCRGYVNLALNYVSNVQWKYPTDIQSLRVSASNLRGAVQQQDMKASHWHEFGMTLKQITKTFLSYTSKRIPTTFVFHYETKRKHNYVSLNSQTYTFLCDLQDQNEPPV